MGWIENAVQKVREFAYTPAVPPSEEMPVPGRRPRVGVALGGGFARGIAHLGVLHALQEHNVPIDCIAGTSAGALAGMAYASGRPFEEVVRKASAIRFGNFGSAAVPVDAARLMGAEVVIAVFLEAESMEKPTNLVDVIGRSFSIVRLQADVGLRLKSDIVITPAVREFSWDDFSRTRDLVAAGEASALEALPQIQAALRPVVTQAQPS
jgi:predicted acylesterase/phospholipase RssA